MSSQLVILAGGLGTRLGALTADTPKPMVLVRGRPFLEWQINYFAAQGFNRILLLTGYKGEVIEKYFGDGSSWGVDITYCREEKPLGTGGALLAARKFLESEFLLMFGDSFLPLEGAAVLAKLLLNPVVMCVYDNREDTTVPFNVRIKGEKVVEYNKTPTKDEARSLAFVEAGVYGIRRAALEGESLRVCSFESDILRPLITLSDVAAFECRHRFFDIGTPERLKFFESRMSDYFPNSI